MSYIIKSTSPFVSIKLTEIGRENLAKGQLNFSYWAIGDSEINYDREAIVDANQTNPVLSGSSIIMRPFDRQPNFKSYITTGARENLNAINSSNINVVKAVVNNEATERGFFTGTSVSTYDTYTSTTYLKSYSTVANNTITGGTIIYISSAATVNINDFIRLKLTNDNSVISSAVENTSPIPNLWYKVQSTATTVSGTAITVDRTLPNLSTQSASTSYVFVYRGGEVADSFGYETSTAYWDSGTLSFDSATNITCDDVKVWNMNNVWCENLAGLTGLTGTNLYEDYTKFGSYNYLGTKNPYLDYLCSSSLSSIPSTCEGPGFSYADEVKKCISILHYTNNTISNLYGEFFYIDTVNNKTVTITIPDIMYHRRNYATSQAVVMGMKFIASGATQTLTNTDIEYISLIEDPSYVDDTPVVVGKVFPQLKMVVIDDEEIVAAMSYKSNRNWTLPSLSAQLANPTGGTTTGLLEVNKTMYLTYALDNTNGTGLTQTLPCQYYIKVTNSSSSSKDVSFKIEDVDVLPYMRQKESLVYDGYGFYATNFKLLYQIVDNQNDRPNPGSWKTYDFTTTAITETVGGTINPYLLETQTPTTAGFTITSALNSIATTYDITLPLSMAPNSNSNILQFGDERFFYGNLETYIGATIYKTIFDIRINSSEYNLTTNPTRSTQASTNPANIKVSEMGIYDSNRNLVVIGKLSEPVSLMAGNTIMFEMSLDF
jgi:hypothetical protein